MLKRIVLSMVLAVMLLVVGCQSDTEFVVRNSTRFLRKSEGFESRSANPYAKTWQWGNQQGTYPQQQH
jgi:hypothetical protein